MAITGFWYLRHATDDEVARLRGPIDDFVAQLRNDAGVQEVMAAWHGWPSRVHGFGPNRQLDRLNRLFLGAFLAANPGENAFLACSRDDIDDQTWDVGRGLPPEHCEALFAHTERFPPLSLLFIGIGPERASWLPGAMGNFALSSAELAEQAEHIRRAHAMAPAERTDAIRRMSTWLEVGSAYSFNTSQMLEAIPAVVGPALMAGKGLLSVSVAM
ncbi:MAG: hypothetical protein OEZ14_06395 [Acidimicrobiia bacterium]|nr:hypothetical protein [Acidimicrobiia bacterium]MDH4307685.1 hypothetical protein [Acidimicrobiia bacterium]MDH5295437.1 hypothetical protein [Acidimicrobiia bacterium]MDH5520146.1 hypothetical protein [Acidimicrobiia bacterium]